MVAKIMKTSMFIALWLVGIFVTIIICDTGGLATSYIN
jgi:hypothetical protein